MIYLPLLPEPHYAARFPFNFEVITDPQRPPLPFKRLPGQSCCPYWSTLGLDTLASNCTALGYDISDACGASNSFLAPRYAATAVSDGRQDASSFHGLTTTGTSRGRGLGSRSEGGVDVSVSLEYIDVVP